MKHLDELSAETLTYFAVTRRRSLGWDKTLPMRMQNRWNDHAKFMDGLAEEGFVVLGGPLGQAEDHFLLIFNATGKEEITARLEKDPWTEMKVLRVTGIEQWEILLRSTSALKS